MTTTPSDPTTALPGRPPIVDLATWQAAQPRGLARGARPVLVLRSDADGNATWGPTSRPVPQWIRPGATPEQSFGRHGDHH